MLDKRGKYYTELSNTIATFNDNSKSSLSKMKIQEAILKVMIEDEEKSIMDANIVPDDAFCHASISPRENPNAIFSSKKI